MEYKCRLRVIFAERNINQRKFAETIKISTTTLSKIVNGNYPSFLTAMKISEELHMSMNEIWVKGE